MSVRLAVAAGLIAITALGFQFFPGHTWLQQDTQIYVPILEHLYDASVLANDPVAAHPHLTYSVWDEMALGVRRITGAGFHSILAADQILFRAVGILGVFLIATAAGLSTRFAFIVAAIYALGASVMGPAVLTVEYEPKPRGSAFGMILLAVGLLGHGRFLPAGIAGSAAFLYHPPSTYPFWIVYCIAALRDSDRRERLRGLIPLGAAAAALFVISRLQTGSPEHFTWFSQLSPELEGLQRYRSSYAWVSTWFAEWVWHYLFLWGCSLLAIHRLGAAIPKNLRDFLYGLPLVGLLSVPASYAAYDVLQWGLMAKFQPARALVWVSLAAVVLAAIACFAAARRGRSVEPFLWGALAFAIPVEHNVWDLLLPDATDPVILRRLLLVVLLGLLAALAGRSREKSGRLSMALAALTVVAPFLLIPSLGKVVTEENMHHAELDSLSSWARAETAPDAVFLFPGAGQGRQPGIFRSKALRAVYTDWKSGGQVNMVEDFAREWWTRYNATMLSEFDPGGLEDYAARGIDYVVLSPAYRLSGREPVFENGLYLVYSLP